MRQILWDFSQQIHVTKNSLKVCTQYTVGPLYNGSYDERPRIRVSNKQVVDKITPQ